MAAIAPLGLSRNGGVLSLGSNSLELGEPTNMDLTELDLESFWLQAIN